MNDMDRELQALLNASVDVKVDDYSPVPDGTYDAIIHTVEFTESKKSGKLMFKWEFIYTTEEYENKHEWKYNVLDKPENMKRLTTDLEKFGVNCSSMDSIRNGMQDLLDVPVLLTIKTTVSKSNGQEYRNISVNPA